MINFNDKRHTAVFFPCAVCNLKCTYCNIDKNTSLESIDNSLEKSFQENYYFNRILQYFPLRYQLKLIETWGGEPFLHMERIHNLLRQIIEYYPYFDSFFSSTNFSYPEWNDKVFDLMKIFEEYPDRKFNLKIQLSCDGPEYINDKGRGLGTTKKCLDNIDIFLNRYEKERPKNVSITFALKPTLSVETILELDSKEKIIEYYNFFETNFYKKFIKAKDLIFFTAIPNVAVPTPATKEIGEKFAQYCKNCQELENESDKYFKYSQKITPYLLPQFDKNDNLFNHYFHQTCLCGSGSSVVGFLPNDLITVCNEGFTQMADEYLKYLSERKEKDFNIVFNNASCKRTLCMTDEEYALYEKNMKYFDCKNQSTLANLALFIKSLAYAKQIEKKYQNDKEALRAARYILNISFCVKDNYNMTGSITTPHFGTIKLLCNGALDYLC